MKKLILAGVAAASLLTSGVVLTPPAEAAYRCWWNGPFQHCNWVGPYRYWGYYHRPGWWYR